MPWLPVRTIVVAAVWLAGSPPVVPTQLAAAENRLKAAVVSKFPQFVEWPRGVLNGRPTVDVCVATPDPFGSDLDELVAGQHLEGRRVVARRIDREQDIDGCQVLFLSAQPDEARHPFLERAALLPILTVSDDPRFLDEGGIVRLRIVDGHVRFDINDAAAQTVGLHISSQLLQLAGAVRRRTT